MHHACLPARRRPYSLVAAFTVHTFSGQGCAVSHLVAASLTVPLLPPLEGLWPLTAWLLLYLQHFLCHPAGGLA